MAGDGAQWFVDGVYAVAAPVGNRHNEGLRRVEHKATDAFGDAAHGGIGQRPGAVKDRRAGQAEVDVIRCCWPTLLAALGLLEVGRLWPADGQAVAAGNQKQALAGCGCAVVAGAQQLVLYLVAELAQVLEEGAPRFALALGVGYQELVLHWYPLARVSHAVDGLAGAGAGDAVERDHAPGGFAALGYQRPPVADLFDVFHRDHGRCCLACPHGDDPRQRTACGAARLAACCLAVVGAVW